MKLDYFHLLSPEPMYFDYIGGVKCPTLREISRLSYPVYQMYLSILSMTPESYYTLIQQTGIYEHLSHQEQASLDIFDLLTSDSGMLPTLEAMLDFFLTAAPKYNKEHRAFLLYEDGKQSECSGFVSRELWSQLCDIILQRNYLKPKNDDLSKIKSKRALSIMQKLQKGRENKKLHAKADKNMEIGNIISAVANKSPSLNIYNIWDITVYQLWDAFYRTCSNSIYDIQSMSVAAYGDKDHHFDANAWFQNFNHNNQ